MTSEAQHVWEAKLSDLIRSMSDQDDGDIRLSQLPGIK